jgi:hypothetical protein
VIFRDEAYVASTTLENIYRALQNSDRWLNRGKGSHEIAMGLKMPILPFIHYRGAVSLVGTNDYAAVFEHFFGMHSCGQRTKHILK